MSEPSVPSDPSQPYGSPGRGGPPGPTYNQPTYGQQPYGQQPPTYGQQQPVYGQQPIYGPQPVYGPQPPIPSPYVPTQQPSYVPNAPQPDSPTPPVEQVGRGILFSLLAIVLGIVLTVIVWQFGFVASITSFAMAWAAVWLYNKGAGAPPRKGTGGLIVVILAGAVLCLVAAIVSDAFMVFSHEYPGAPMGDLLAASLSVLGEGDVWSAYGGTIVMFLVFAGLGIFSTLRRLGAQK